METKKDILIMGIETSCDETSASIVLNGRKVVSNIISSQISLHQKYGGVVPEIASRKHVELMIPVIDEALDKAGIKLKDLDAIGVTYGPGLVGALLVGLSAAKGLAFAIDKPLVGVHHIEGHIAANYIQHEELEPPFICLVASGGHSHIVYVESYDKFQILGQTRDDAAGEAFDKIARAIGLGYPGGRLLTKLQVKETLKPLTSPGFILMEVHWISVSAGLKLLC
ncbi:metalloendopeptidase, glycoprotease family [Pseudobacteroides cellulosolvens ATCC 35603 = DSM 2933]|uniref:N(6)-L-threonylcarbamoyladenine synthase n=1 Tax=Pseudobacteroides cellulosolvens ATCC 35603 = DSM 2933 TaxID=398512 RepID=A0A0L6JTG7_9FIRM|nr:metalloendopeptidase, glycoprotease family [Pseudobacteroides cellulosolvens ATCC 35603 = DSM 2933]